MNMRRQKMNQSPVHNLGSSFKPCTQLMTSETTQTARLQLQIDLAVMDKSLQDLRCVLAGCRSLMFSQIRRVCFQGAQSSLCGVPSTYVLEFTCQGLLLGRRGHVLLMTDPLHTLMDVFAAIIKLSSTGWASVI